jgi:type I restriction enzyme S subunit
MTSTNADGTTGFLNDLVWAGEVPAHWDRPRLKTVLAERVSKGHPHEPLLAATQTMGVVRKDRYENRTVEALKDLHLLKIVHEGDFVISLRSFQGGIEYARDRGIISPAYTVLYPKAATNHRYLAHLFKSKPFIENLQLFVTGIRQGQNIDYEKLSRSRIPLPPLEEQAAIVRFLDYADQRIRRYVRAKQKLIKLLEEQKQAIIHRAVTRGLDPNVRLKPSGVDWLGEVPEAWEVCLFKNCVRFQEGPGIMRADFRESGIPLLRISCFRDSSNPLAGCNYLDPSKVKVKWSHFKVQAGDYILNASTSAAVVKLWKALPAIVGAIPYTGLIRLWPRREGIDMAYVDLLFQSPLVQEQLLLARTGVGIAHFGPSHLKKLVLLLPPQGDREAILRSATVRLTEFDRVIKKAEIEILRMLEYRTRLIADVVTGKLEVRDAASQLPDEIDFSDDETFDTKGLLDDAEVGEELEGVGVG